MGYDLIILRLFKMVRGMKLFKLSMHLDWFEHIARVHAFNKFIF